MVQLYSWLHSTFKELSNDTSHAQIRVQTKKLCHQQVGEENKSLSRFCRNKASDKAFLRQNQDFVATELVTNSVVTKQDFVAKNLATNFVTTKPDLVATEAMTRLSCHKTKFCRNRVSKKLCHDKPSFVTIELATNSVVTNPDFVTTEFVAKTLSR